MQGELISEVLTEEEFESLCGRFEEQFDVREKKVRSTGIYYELKAGVNRMRWVDSASLLLECLEDGRVRVRYAISTQVFIIMSVIGLIVSIGYRLLTDVHSYVWYIAFVFPPLMYILSKVAYFVFTTRIRYTVAQAIGQRVMVSEEQHQWSVDPSLCPACGMAVVEEVTCPDCGLQLR